MRTRYVLLLLAALLMTVCAPALYATDVCGSVSGIWDIAGSPYVVICDILIPDGEQLDILPGVEVLFNCHCRFEVLGRINALGTAGDSIRFTRAAPDGEPWWGIRFRDTSDDASLFEYCVFDHAAKGNGNGADYNGGAVYVQWSTPTFRHCAFRDNTASRGGAICGYMGGASFTVDQCLFERNTAIYGAAVWMRDNGIISRSTIVNNFEGPAVYTESNGVTTLTSSIVAFNEGAAFMTGGAAINYCDVFANNGGLGDPPPGVGVITGQNANGDPCDNFHNILLDPAFVDPAAGNYRLQPVSPCIDAGDPGLNPDPDGSVADIGAFSFAAPPVEGAIVHLVRRAEPLVPVDAWDTGPVECPQSLVVTFAVRNFGTDPAVIYAVQGPTNADSVFMIADFCTAPFDLPPHQTSACSLRITFWGPEEGVFLDSIRIQTNADNAVGGFVTVPVTAVRTYTPPPPNLTVAREGNNAVLRWNAVTHTIGGCPIVPVYLILYSELPDGPFWFHGFATTTRYDHIGVIRFARDMFYQVVVSTAPLTLITSLPPGLPATDLPRLLRE